MPLSNAVSYNQSDMDNEMIAAAKINDFARFKCLVEKGANINAKDSFGISAIVYASGYGSADIVEYLINNGADVNAANSDGETALIFAASSAYTAAILGPKDHVEMVRNLITKGK